MVFNSLTFLLFFAVVLAVHHLPLSWTFKKINLLIASFLFYAAWNPPFVALLLISAVVDFALGKAIFRAPSLARRRSLLALSLCLNLGLLSYFKYGGFLLRNFTALMHLLHIPYQPAAPNIILPLGISFYTFETISYLIDIYRGKLRPSAPFVDYALFLAFFPHLVAGPIVRAGDFLPQCQNPRRPTSRQLGWGLTLMTVGLFEKIVLADGFFAPVADSVFAAAHPVAFADAWTATIAFAGQIFFDFAGYSTCGIGAALCFAFVLNDNFHFPYAAVGFSDFWKRWHMSLSSWLRDYLYIPLGGNRKGPFRTYLNLALTMLLGGLWHGASWTFVAWGGLHASYLVLERFLKKIIGEFPLLSTRIIQLALAALTYLLVCIAWVPFRARSFSLSLSLLRQMFSPSLHHTVVLRSTVACVFLLTAALLSFQWLMRNTSLEHAAAKIPWWARSTLLAVMLCAIVLVPGDSRAFIYFQF